MNIKQARDVRYTQCLSRVSMYVTTQKLNYYLKKKTVELMRFIQSPVVEYFYYYIILSAFQKS